MALCKFTFIKTCENYNLFLHYEYCCLHQDMSLRMYDSLLYSTSVSRFKPCQKNGYRKTIVINKIEKERIK